MVKLSSDFAHDEIMVWWPKPERITLEKISRKLKYHSSVRLESWIQLKISFQLKPSLNWTFNFQLSTFNLRVSTEQSSQVPGDPHLVRCPLIKISRHPHLVRCPLIKLSRHPQSAQLKVESWNLKVQLRDGFNWKESFNWIQVSSLTCMKYQFIKDRKIRTTR